jgi:hypothetical protein
MDNMAAFQTDQEIISEKSQLDTFSDVEKAFIKIGKVQQVDRQACTIQGTTKYGLQTVKIHVRVEVIDNKTKVLFHGKSDDFGAIGAQNGIAKLVAAMQYSNADGTEIPEVKASAGKILFMWIFALLGGLIGIFLASSIVNSKNVDGSPMYTKANRNQATAALIVSVVMIIFYSILYFRN